MGPWPCLLASGENESDTVHFRTALAGPSYAQAFVADLFRRDKIEVVGGLHVSRATTPLRVAASALPFITVTFGPKLGPSSPNTVRQQRFRYLHRPRCSVLIDSVIGLLTSGQITSRDLRRSRWQLGETNLP